MTTLSTAFAKAHERNIDRYHHLLKTRLSDVERNYIESRILAERAALRALSATDDLAAVAAGGGMPSQE